jgi:hypothetical protein
MATSRRTRATGGRPPAASSSRNRAPAASALEPIDPAAPDEPAAEEAAPEEASSGSSRRGAARNSRRVKAQSSAKSPVAKSARVLTPEEKAARGKAVKSFLLLVVCLVLFLGAVAGGWYFFLRENPLAREAQAILSEGDRKLRLIDSTLNKRQPKLAREAFNDGLKLLGVPMLGNAKEPIDEHDPILASRQQAQKAVDLAKAIRATEPRIDRIERDLKAEGNHRKVMEGFRKLNELDEAALVEHEKLTDLFLKNPVEPPAGGRDEYVADYAGLIQEVSSQKIRIEQEKERRLAAITSDQEKLAHGEVRALVKEEHFKDALDKLAAFKEKFEQGKFDNLRAFVEGSAKQAWESAEKYADSRYTDYKSPGIPKAIGDQALRDARTRMDQVVERFGIEEYVSKAKALLEKYPKP